MQFLHGGRDGGGFRRDVGTPARRAFQVLGGRRRRGHVIFDNVSVFLQQK